MTKRVLSPVSLDTVPKIRKTLMPRRRCPCSVPRAPTSFADLTPEAQEVLVRKFIPVASPSCRFLLSGYRTASALAVFHLNRRYGSVTHQRIPYAMVGYISDFLFPGKVDHFVRSDVYVFQNGHVFPINVITYGWCSPCKRKPCACSHDVTLSDPFMSMDEHMDVRLSCSIVLLFFGSLTENEASELHLTDHMLHEGLYHGLTGGISNVRVVGPNIHDDFWSLTDCSESSEMERLIWQYGGVHRRAGYPLTGQVMPAVSRVGYSIGDTPGQSVYLDMRGAIVSTSSCDDCLHDFDEDKETWKSSEILMSFLQTCRKSIPNGLAVPVDVIRRNQTCGCIHWSPEGPFGILEEVAAGITKFPRYDRLLLAAISNHPPILM